MVITSALHAEGPGFKPQMNQNVYFFLIFKVLFKPQTVIVVLPGWLLYATAHHCFEGLNPMSALQCLAIA